ncbi:MAG: prepilin-type N-terminal cleavage/methylation domain-containing protein [Chloroflexi bacterium]|nr:prepilin-type N-terminal cleavage/methylation domain-containing protein [Chloroflexota bacterium]
MRIPKKGEKGFTLIELLIVVAILGVLAAVVIPNVGRFIGRGGAEAKATEFSNIQSAVQAMMTDNKIALLPTPVTTTHTKDMNLFPDTTAAASKGTDILGNTYAAGDGAGFVLYQHDRIADGASGNLTNYVATQTTSYWYTVDAQGTVTQYDVP